MLFNLYRVDGRWFVVPAMFQTPRALQHRGARAPECSVDIHLDALSARMYDELGESGYAALEASLESFVVASCTVQAA